MVAPVIDTQVSVAQTCSPYLSFIDKVEAALELFSSASDLVGSGDVASGWEEVSHSLFLHAANPDGQGWINTAFRRYVASECSGAIGRLRGD